MAPKKDAFILENDPLRASFSREDGALVGLFNKAAEVELIAAPPAARTPWELVFEPAEPETEPRTFSFERPGGPPGEVETAFSAFDCEPIAHGLRLRWTAPHGVVVTAEAVLPPGADRLELRCGAENGGARTLLALRYPTLQGIGALAGDGERDRLLNASMMGAVFKNPLRLFKEGGAQLREGGFRHCRYPNGFFGSALQMMAFYAEDVGGFYVAAEDGAASDKDFNFFRSADGLTAQVAHYQADARPGQDLQLDYPTVIAPLTRGTWTEAAERYRAWGTRQSWCARGTRRERAARGDAASWLLEEIGAVGIWWPFQLDVREHVARMRQVVGAPLLHLELSWGHTESRAAARAAGHYFGPFYFPHLAYDGRPGFDALRAEAIQPQVSVPTPHWVPMCPLQPGWRAVFLETAEDLAGHGPVRHQQIWIDHNAHGCDADALYYDIGPAAGVATNCYAHGHAHGRGQSAAVVAAHAELLAESGRRAAKVRGAYVPVGTECASEPLVGALDMYYARNAGFHTMMETFPFVRLLTWLPDGEMETVPLLEYVYHEYGPVAIQHTYTAANWLDDDRDFWVWADVRATLWGGLLVTAPMPQAVDADSPRAPFIRNLVAARTGFAKEYLAYGRMQRPVQVDCGTLEIDHGLGEGGWLRERVFTPEGIKRELEAYPLGVQGSGLDLDAWVAGVTQMPAFPARTATFAAPEVLSQAYTLADGRLGVLLANIGPASKAFAVSLDPADYGLSAGRVRRAAASGETELGAFDGAVRVELELPAREFVLLELVPG